MSSTHVINCQLDERLKLHVCCIQRLLNISILLNVLSDYFFEDLDMEFGDLLQEFNDVVEELRVPSQSTPCVYGHLLSEAKRRDGVSDSGIEDSDYSEFFFSYID